MSTGLLTQLETYYAELDAAQAAIEPEEIAALGEQVRELPVGLRPSPVRGLRTAIAAAIGVIALFGGLAWLTRSSNDAEPSDRPAVTTIVPDGPVATTLPPDQLSAGPTAPQAETSEPVGSDQGDVAETFDIGQFDLSLTDLVGSEGLVWFRPAGNFATTGPLIYDVGRFDPITGDLDTIDLPSTDSVRDLAVTPDAVWVLAARDVRPWSILRFDPGGLAEEAAIELPWIDADSEAELVVAGGGVWVAHAGGFTRLDASTLETEVHAISDTALPRWLGEHRGALWAQREVQVDSILTRIDLTSGEVADYRIPVAGLGVLGADEIWVFNTSGSIARFDLSALETTHLDQLDRRLGSFGSSAVVVQGGVWFSNPADMTITRLDAVTGDITDVIALDLIPGNLATDERALWVSARGAGWSRDVARIDLATRSVSEAIEGIGLGTLYSIDGAVWLTSGGELTLLPRS